MPLTTNALAHIDLDTSHLLLSVFAALITFIFQDAVAYLKVKLGWTQKRCRPQKGVSAPWAGTASTIQEASAVVARKGCECPYEYLLQVYGSNHFTSIIDILNSRLKSQDSDLYRLILEIMDAIHFGAILVDDVADNSVLRKGKPAAHRIYGSSETINRAYLRIFEVMEKCRKLRPSLIPYILDNLNQIHKGQDMSLVWRRDGFDYAPDQKSALDIYRHSAYLKTGALFRLIGQLVFGTDERDEIMSQVGWFCHLQNDCKNIYSSDVIAAKGALAEDLINGEYTFPIIVGLYSSLPGRNTVQKALCKDRELDFAAQDRQHEAALVVLQSGEVKDLCMNELESLKLQNPHFASVWGRRETMTLGRT